MGQRHGSAGQGTLSVAFGGRILLFVIRSQKVEEGRRKGKVQASINTIWSLSTILFHYNLEMLMSMAFFLLLSGTIKHTSIYHSIKFSQILADACTILKI
jgi:type III secretory pathway component EscU